MNRLFILCVALVFSHAVVSAGDDARKGTAGAQQLLIPVGARSIATSGAFLPSLQGAEAIYYNPAGLSAVPYSEAMFSYMTYLADINVSYVAVSANFRDIGAFGLSFNTLDFGDIPITTFEHPDGTGTTYSPGFYVVGLTYARSITDRVSAGVTVKLVNETIIGTSAMGGAVDIGIQYRFVGNLSIGAALKNIGSSMSYSGADLQVRNDLPGAPPGSDQGTYSPETEAFQIPSYFEMGLNYTADINPQNAVIIGTTFRNNNTLQDELKLGLEYKLMNMFSVRGGYEMLTKDQDQSVYGLSLGVGLEYELENSVRFSFDYAFRAIKEFPTDNHVFTVKLGL